MLSHRFPSVSLIFKCSCIHTIQKTLPKIDSSTGISKDHVLVSSDGRTLDRSSDCIRTTDLKAILVTDKDGVILAQGIIEYS